MMNEAKTIDDVLEKLDTLATKEDLRVLDARIEAKIDTKIDTKIDASVGGLAIMVNEGFVAMGNAMEEMRSELTERIVALEKGMQGMHQNFDAVFQELKYIREEIKEVDSRADVADLQVRVAELEKKAKIRAAR